MVFTANDLSGWKDFPKGLRVLLLDEDIGSAAEIKSKLEAMNYIVSVFCNESEALSEISKRPESFHVAIVEVNISDCNGSFKFLENAKDLPTIMTSNIHCLNTMMKCIALGAVEFLHKPLSEDKLRNIWQHVVHKAFNAGESNLSESLKPVKQSLVSMLQLKLENQKPKNNEADERENVALTDEKEQEQSVGSDKYPAPSTPQLKQGARLLDDGDCQDHINSSTEKDSVEQVGESKSVETTSGDSIAAVNGQVVQPEEVLDIIVKEEVGVADGLKSGGNMHPCAQSKDGPNDSHGFNNPSKASGLHSTFGNKANRKKMKVDWTPELHKKFVQAVEKLGVDQAIPSRILELMKVEGLTRHNVASHLQKYRMHRRNILPKEDDRRWVQPRDQTQRSYYVQKPIMAYPPYHSSPATAAGPVYPIWGATTGSPHGVQMWGSIGYPQWQATESWHWKPYAGMHADAWGCPMMPPLHGPFPTSPQNASGFHCMATTDNGCRMPYPNSFDSYPAEEEIDRVVKEAINKPWLPLPLGLKPPSTDSVLTELSRKGISTVPHIVDGTDQR